jgi:hypothetical protein
MPTTAVQTYSNTRLDPLMDPLTAFRGIVNVGLKASTTFTKGMVLGEITASPGVYGPYATGAGDGTANAAVILQYDCVTDASNNITVMGEWAVTRKSAPVYTHGTFSLADIVTTGTGALDAGAVTKLGGRIVQGTIASASGIFTF